VGAEERAACEEIYGMKDANLLLYDRHVAFLNCSRHGFPQPAFFNMLRHPVDRSSPASTTS
jgi:hypothetical protein